MNIKQKLQIKNKNSDKKIFLRLAWLLQSLSSLCADVLHRSVHGKEGKEGWRERGKGRHREKGKDEEANGLRKKRGKDEGEEKKILKKN